MKKYRNIETANISFPLGGIGTGSIGLAGNGALVDWEINNRPNRESINPFTNIAVKAEDDTKVIDMRFLNGDPQRDFLGTLHIGNCSWGYGDGINRGTVAGCRHFEHTEFTGDFPMAHVDFEDQRFPGLVRMTAFNPFIPSNDKDSSIPGAMFVFDIENNSSKSLRYTLAISVTNPLSSLGLHSLKKEENAGFLTINGADTDPDSLKYGNVTIATDAEEIAPQLYWYRGDWFDNLTMFLNDFGAFGPIRPRVYDKSATRGTETATLTASVDLKSGERKSLRFVITWYVPNVHRYWGANQTEETHVDWKNYYASLFTSSADAAMYCLKNWTRLERDTRLFKDALSNSDLPASVLDAIQGNLATLKSTTCLRLENGDFYAWEGVHRNEGSCEGTCQHVWNYTYAMPFLFPKLELGLRNNELMHSLDKDGGMHFRIQLPIGCKNYWFRPCVDGQMGTIMKCYREWKISGNTDWLKKVWPEIKKCLEYAWSPQNEDRWDPDKTGVIFGRQHHTLDVELFGAYAWLTGFYHGALLAAAEMAEAMGEETLSGEYRAIYERGHKWLEENTFNGSHYIQLIDIRDKGFFERLGLDFEKGNLGYYWDSENNAIKYQIENGCEIDQVLADWHAGLMGLPNIFDQENRKKALLSIYRINRKNMRDLNNPCRVFALNGETGVTMCAWDEGVSKPDIPIPYSEEVMTGFEYAFAGGLLQCGFEEESTDVVKGIRDRYDGAKRNPFAELECGASYARAMASYALLLIYSGFKYDMTKGRIGFKPIHAGRYFWSIDGAWGDVEANEKGITVKALYGTIHIREFVHNLDTVSKVALNGKEIPFEVHDDIVYTDALFNAGDILSFQA